MGGMMVCALPQSHCVLLCDDTTPCPDGMVCSLDFMCHYNENDEPADGDPFWPRYEDSACPEGTYGPISIVPAPFYLCAPQCDGTGRDAPCPQAATGSATPVCAFNPDSSGTPC